MNEYEDNMGSAAGTTDPQKSSQIKMLPDNVAYSFGSSSDGDDLE